MTMVMNGLATHQVMPMVYDELKTYAHNQLKKEKPGQTLQTTGLVHEAYVRLVGSTDPGWQGRAHFFGAAARAMRHILADSLQKKGSLKRGGNLLRVDTDTMAELAADGPSDELLGSRDDRHQGITRG